MAGAVSKTFGSILTVLGGLLLVIGLAAFGWGVTTLEEESRRTFPDEERMDFALGVAMAGLLGVGSGYLLLLAGIPLLVWGFHRVRDPRTGETSTRPGGALKAWGATFLVLGVVALVVGLVVAAFGANVADEETRRMFESDDRMEAAAWLAVGGLGVAGFGLGLVLLGIPFAIAGSAKADRAAPTAPAPPAPSAASASAPARSGDSSSRAAAFIVGGVVLASLLLLLLFGGVGFGGMFPEASGEDAPQPVTRAFEGGLQGGAAPVVGGVGAGTQARSHAMDPGMRSGSLEAALEWTSTAPSGPLALILEVETSEGQWQEVQRAEGGSPLAARTGTLDFTGSVRATVTFAEGSGGAVQYRLVLQATPS